MGSLQVRTSSGGCPLDLCVDGGSVRQSTISKPEVKVMTGLMVSSFSAAEWSSDVVAVQIWFKVFEFGFLPKLGDVAVGILRTSEVDLAGRRFAAETHLNFPRSDAGVGSPGGGDCG